MEIGVCGGNVIYNEDIGDAAIVYEIGKASSEITFIDDIGFLKSGSDEGCRCVAVGFFDDYKFSAVVDVGFDNGQREVTAEEYAVCVASFCITVVS